MKKIIISFLFISLFTACVPNEEAQKPLKIVKKNSAKTERFYDLTHNLMKTFDAGKMEEVKEMISELKSMTPSFSDNWNYGNAIHKVNIVQGRIALKEDKIEEAKSFLVAAGKAPSSPQLSTFGPNMKLAKDLLLKEEKAAVIEYLDLCKAFWMSEEGRVAEWKKAIEENRIPQFGKTLDY